jgi:hypothetical protein
VQRSGSATSGTSRLRGDDWHSTRSLFVAMEEMALLAAQEASAAAAAAAISDNSGCAAGSSGNTHADAPMKR